MKNLIISALIGNLSVSEAIQLSTTKTNQEKLNIFVQIGDESDELGIPGLSVGPKAPADPAVQAIVD